MEGNVSRGVLWTIAVAGFAEPYFQDLISSCAGSGQARSTPPSQLYVASLLAIPVALIATMLTYKRFTRRRRFRAPSSAAADCSLLAFALFAALYWIIPKVPLFRDMPIEFAYAGPLAIALWALRTLGHRRLEHAWGLGCGTGAARETMFGILAFAWLLPISVLFFHGLQQTLHADGVGSSFAKRCVEALVVVPVVEETFFRGAFYCALRRSQGWLAAMTIDAFVFAIAHGGYENPWSTVGYGACGLVFCIVREYRGSLVACIAAHALLNTVPILSTMTS